MKQPRVTFTCGGPGAIWKKRGSEKLEAGPEQTNQITPRPWAKCTPLTLDMTKPRPQTAEASFSSKDVNWCINISTKNESFPD